MKVTNEVLVAALGCDPFTAVAWNDALNEAFEKFQINTPKRIAAFLAQVGVESSGLTHLVENLNYSAARLAVVWSGRYAENPHAALKVPNPKAYELANKPQALANDVYAFRLGNGAPSTGDGWNYRGQGPIQLTGRANVTAASKACGLDLVNHPELMQEPSGGAMSAAWFFAVFKGCNELADADNIDAITAKVNGQASCAENKGPERADRFRAALPLLEALASPPAPAKSTAKAVPKPASNA